MKDAVQFGMILPRELRVAAVQHARDIGVSCGTFMRHCLKAWLSIDEPLPVLIARESLDNDYVKRLTAEELSALNS